MKSSILAFTLLATVALIAGAALVPAPAAPAPATAAAATTFQVDPVHSTGIFRIHHNGAGMFYGRFNNVTGTIAYDAANPATLAFDVAIEVESVDTGSERLDGHLKSPDFFNAAEFAQMTFKSTEASAVDDDTYKVTGDLTIHGVTKSITTDVDLTGMREGRRGAVIGFETVFTVDRTEFGMAYGIDRGALGKDVRLIVALEAGAANPAASD